MLLECLDAFDHRAEPTTVRIRRMAGWVSAQGNATQHGMKHDAHSLDAFEHKADPTTSEISGRVPGCF